MTIARNFRQIIVENKKHFSMQLSITTIRHLHAIYTVSQKTLHLDDFITCFNFQTIYQVGGLQLILVTNTTVTF